MMEITFTSFKAVMDQIKAMLDRSIVYISNY